MKVIGYHNFPETAEEAREWQEVKKWRALHSRVMCFAHTRVEGMWVAYCFPVPGNNHGVEWNRWEEFGEKLDQSIAVAVFPEFKGIPYAR